MRDEIKELFEEWKDMPEFEQDDKTEYSSVRVLFETEEDMMAFSKLVGRKVTKKTKGFFFPVLEKSPRMEYVDEPTTK